MSGLEERVGTRLEWRQPETWRRHHYLSSEGQVIASVRFEKTFGTFATVEHNGRVWTCKRVGLWPPRVSVRAPGSEVDIATFTPHGVGGGDAVFASGARFQLRPVDFWGREWAFETAAGAEVVRVCGPNALAAGSGEAWLGLAGARLPETPILLLLVWYLRVLMVEDAAAVTAIARGA